MPEATIDYLEVKEKADILIVNGLVVPMTPDRAVIDNGAVAIKDGLIVSIGPGKQLETKYTADKIIDAGNQIVMPGLINTHTHAAMTLFRGLADDVALQVWLEEHIWKAEAQYINADTVILGTNLAIAEMLHSGTTTFNDMYFFADEVAMTAKKAGIRAVVSEGLLNFPTPSVPNPGDSISTTERLLLKWQGDNLVRIAVAAHSPYTCSAELLQHVRMLSDKYQTPLHIHVSETKAEVEDIVSKTGLTPVAYLNSIGFLWDNVIAVHCVHLTGLDIQLLEQSNVKVAHNPISNAKLGSGIAPVPELLSAGVVVGLGTDGAASNNRLDMFEEMAMAARIHKAFNLDPLAVDAYSALKMATIDAARVLGISDITGSLEKGKRADIILVDALKPNMVPMYNVFSHLVYAANSSQVDTVIIEGQIVMEKQKILTLDETSIIEQVSRFAGKLKTGQS